MTYIVETLKNGEFKAIIKHDYDTESPREWDNVGTVALHTRAGNKYGFGDESLDAEYMQELISSGEYLHLHIYLYDHSGITIRTSPFSCRFDSGCAGIIYVKRSDLPAIAQAHGHTPWTDEQVLDILQSEIDVLDQYITGDVYQFRIEDPHGNVLDSCGGLYGMTCTREEAQAALDLHANKERSESEYWACRDVVTA